MIINRILYKLKSIIASKRRVVKHEYIHSQNYTIISCNCIGGLLYHDFGQKFLSPTINLYIESPDFIKFCKDLSGYLSYDLMELRESNKYPIGILKDIKIHFLHYKSFEEAKFKWNVRKKRINWDNIFVIMTDRDNYKEELLPEFLQLPYKKVLFSHKNNDMNEVVFVKCDEKKEEVSDLTKYYDLTGKKTYEYYFDFDKWLTGKYTTGECKMNEKLKLFVVTHKEVSYLPQGRTFIGVGKNLAIPNVNIYDSSGDNITYKNESYCELTALYWIWKNIKVDFVGLEHYRRFFCEKKSFWKVQPISKDKINRILRTHDCIVSQKFKFKEGLYSYYKKNHFQSDLDICKEVIMEKYPEYKDSFDKIIYGKYAVMCNMFIMRKELLDEYCQWLFAILFETEKRIDVTNRDSYQKRVFGFLSERLFNVWLDFKKLKLYHLPIYFPDDKPYKIYFKKFFKILLGK